AGPLVDHSAAYRLRRSSRAGELPPVRARGRGRGAGRERLPLPADDHRRSQGRHGCRRDHRAVNAPLAASPLEPAGTVRGARWRARAAVATVGMLALLAGWLLWDNRRLEVTTY